MVSIKSHLLTDSVKSNLAAVASGKIVERIVYQFDKLPQVKVLMGLFTNMISYLRLKC